MRSLLASSLLVAWRSSAKRASAGPIPQPSSVTAMRGSFWTAPNGPHFDDSYWPPAADAGDNGVLPWGHRPDISGEAHWIWSADPDAHDAVRCRYESSHKAIDCPAAESRYWQDYNDVAA